MPLLDIATFQPSLQNIVQLRAQSLIHCKALPNPWKSSQLPKYVNISVGYPHIRRGKLLVAAVATLEPRCSVQQEDEKPNMQVGVSSSPSEDQHEISGENSGEVDEKERLRRMRISKANKGNTPWNKGKKHSPETLQRIRERTKLAMQNPKVKMKLVNLGHAQSEETRAKIGKGVRMGWEKRKEKLMVQETCCFEWQNLIAAAARRGYIGEEELQWDSYEILDEQLKQEWLESVEQRKAMPRPKGSKRAPKSAEQRRKIAEAIAAKWADPAYRNRVCAGLAKYHGTPAGAERKPRRRPSEATESTRNNSKKKNTSDVRSSSRVESKRQIQHLRRRRNGPSYKDPLANSKLEMIKNIRSERTAAETKKLEAIERARLLITEALKAAKSLELAAMKSPIAQASLMETRKLIDEAIQSIESIENGQITSYVNGEYPSTASADLVSQVQKETGVDKRDSDEGDHREVNGSQILSLNEIEGLDFTNLTLQGMVNGEKELSPRGSSYGLSTFNLDDMIVQSASAKKLGRLEPYGNINPEKSPLLNGAKVRQLETNGNTKCVNDPLPNGAKLQLMEGERPLTITRKWVRGRLVEVTEGA